ncbi:NADH-quinone oxidoreductase subunit NuoK [Desulfuromonas acetoxidans]|uniref:NADH-quinone oxidoreductase subunit K n=1 Tax=Desulfuromonas acetoxidans (strain DSM 684 / 11070) TaxID=281689 RepID=Q1K3R8_DESA6|nr:NADH-quinone oxidoreductase subunit NuoK [Desulfuromonas acetoxidans]EAT17385.1 NADH-ubiquinone oxidoreductase, chain 4L [Desulfuromonas acetoxidans DSM 684]MBF0644231.1 NADH-quinone oxidoreductase subunit NuoK [Desulfuromonas acetoxidans]NVD24899.1 NADH-quinone oxidoreductase subunit NuoK [Desulfuromonas acetoxidans]NVE15200.1 NADH-quinone oxidoreductase subunit NuoK [Desulfuromonas acetoxidans]
MIISDNLNTYLIIAAILLVIGLYGMLRHRSLIGMLISSEFILNGAALNFMAFNRFVAPNPAVGQIYTLFIMGIAAAEAAIVVSIIIAVYRKYRSEDPEQVQDLKM